MFAAQPSFSTTTTWLSAPNWGVALAVWEIGVRGFGVRGVGSGFGVWGLRGSGFRKRKADRCSARNARAFIP